MLHHAISFRDCPRVDAHFLKRTAVHAILVFQMKGNSCGLSWRDNLCFEGHRFGRIHICNRQSSQVLPMLIVEASDQASRKKHSKRTGELDLSVVETSSPKWPNQNARISHTVKFASGSRGEPFRLEVAALARMQTAHRTVDFGFKVVRAGIGIHPQGWYSVTIQPQFRPVGPEN